MKKQVQFYSLLNSLHKLNTFQYAKYVKSIIDSSYFRKSIKSKKLKINYLNKRIFNDSLEDIYFYKDKTGNFYYFKYFMVNFNYDFNNNDDLSLKLMNINIINNGTYNLIQLLITKQNRFLNSGLIKDLLLIRRIQLVDEYKLIHNDYFDKTLISRIIKKSFRMDDAIHNLSLLIPKKSYYYSIFIFKIINDKTSLNDEEIVKELFCRFGLKLDRREVCYIRNKYFIPKSSSRHDVLFYKNYEPRFSKVKVLNKENLQSLIYNASGIYELLSDELEEYPYSSSTTIYIGSSKNLKKRMNTYLNNNSHNILFDRYFQSNKKIYFRYIENEYYKFLEKRFLDSFFKLFGSLPLLNIQRIK